MRGARRRTIRRDRRKAKASGWKRAGKPMGAKVGHGSGATVARKAPHPKSRPLLPEAAPPRKEPAPRFRLKQQPFSKLATPVIPTDTRGQQPTDTGERG